MDKSDLKVLEVKTQESVENIYGRSVRLDVLAKDSCGKIYDIPDTVGYDLIAKAEEFTDCKITSMDITFRGLCRECEDKHKEKYDNNRDETEFALSVTNTKNVLSEISEQQKIL